MKELIENNQHYFGFGALGGYLFHLFFLSDTFMFWDIILRTSGALIMALCIGIVTVIGKKIGERISDKHIFKNKNKKDGRKDENAA